MDVVQVVVQISEPTGDDTLESTIDEDVVEDLISVPGKPAGQLRRLGAYKKIIALEHEHRGCCFPSFAILQQTPVLEKHVSIDSTRLNRLNLLAFL